MNRVENAFAAIVAAWDLLVDRPLPQPGRRAAARPSSLGILVSFPLVGVILGILPLAVAGVVALIFNRTAGALCFALLAGILLYLKDSGRGTALLVSYVAARLSGAAPREALEEADSRLEQVLQRPVVMLFSIVAVMVLLGMLFILYYRGAGVWFIAVAAADAFVQGRMCLEKNGNTGLPFIQIPGGRGSVSLALTGGVIALLLLIAFPKIAALGAMVIVWIWFWRELPESDIFRSGVSADGISLCGFWASLLVLICGMGLL